MKELKFLSKIKSWEKKSFFLICENMFEQREKIHLHQTS